MPADYRNLTPRDIARMTEKEARAAYSQLRSVFNKRLTRLSEAGYKREITPETFRPLRELAREDVKQELRELSYYSRRHEYSLSEMAKRTKGLQRWMAEHGYKHPTKEAAQRFGQFMGKLRDSGITMESGPTRYMNITDETVKAFSKKENIDEIFENFDAWTQLTASGVDVDGAIQNGEVFGMDIRTAARHKRALTEYADELRELSNEDTFKKPRTDKDVDNLIRRARRLRSSRG